MMDWGPWFKDVLICAALFFIVATLLWHTLYWALRIGQYLLLQLAELLV